jgi:catechol 2,3-dioxygenase-like lactoylglutathione lyase family enzyme
MLEYLSRMSAQSSREPPAALKSAILETCLTVANLERSREFYAGLFGYPVMGSDERFCVFDINESQVLLLFTESHPAQPVNLPFGTIPGHGTRGTSHIGFSVRADDLPAWRQHLTEHGINVESRVQWPRGGISLYFRDPDGHLLELLTPGVWPTY